MAQIRLTKLQFQIMDIFWERGGLSVREVHDALPAPRPAYTDPNPQTLIGRLESQRRFLRAHTQRSALHAFSKQSYRA